MESAHLSTYAVAEANFQLSGLSNTVPSLSQRIQQDAAEDMPTLLAHNSPEILTQAAQTQAARMQAAAMLAAAEGGRAGAAVSAAWPSSFAIEHYVLDADVAACPRCVRSFGFFLRKHHCRGCGACACDRCLSQRHAFVDGQPAVRVCNDCPNPELVRARAAAQEAQKAAERQLRVFISCSRDAAPFADVLAEFLRSKGRVCIRSGDDAVESCGTFVYVASPQWLEALKQLEAEDNVCRAELTQALAAHAEPSLGTALVPVLHADCGGFPSKHIPQIDAALRQAFNFTFIFHHVQPKHYAVFLELLLERIDAVDSGANLRRKVFLSHKQLDSQDFIRIIACYLDRLGVSYFLDVDHLLANHDLKELTASCDYFLYVKSEEWLKDVQLPMPDSPEEDQHKIDYPVATPTTPEVGQFEGEHWKGRHNSWCRQELATALEVHADDPSKLVPIQHKSFSDETAAHVPPALAVAMEVKAVEHHFGGKHFAAFIEELLERMGIAVQALPAVVAAQASGIPRDLFSTDELAASTSLSLDMIEFVMSSFTSSTSEHAPTRTGSTAAMDDESLDSIPRISKDQLKAELEAAKAEAAKVPSLEAQLQKTRSRLSERSSQSVASRLDSEHDSGEQAQVSSADSVEATKAAADAREKELLSKLAERDAALSSMAPAADAAVSAGLISAAEADHLQGGGGGARAAEQAERLMPSGERAELERELKEMLDADTSLGVYPITGDSLVMSEMSVEKLRAKITELHPLSFDVDNLQ